MANCNAGKGLGWTCKREATVGDLCNSHYRQKLRGRPFTQLRQRDGDRERLSGVRVGSETVDELEAEAAETRKAVATVAGEVLDAWAQRRGARRE